MDLGVSLPEKEVCRKPDDIFESRKTGKIEKICGKLFFKIAETGKLFWKAAENRKTPKRQWKVA